MIAQTSIGKLTFETLSAVQLLQPHSPNVCPFDWKLFQQKNINHLKQKSTSKLNA